MSHDKNRILDKLKKLFALSESNNPHEAARALERAQKLIQTHGISQEDIALSDINESISEYWPVGGVNPPRYMLRLLGIIRDAFAVNCLLLGGRGVSFYGPQSRTALAAYTFEVLGRQLIKGRKAFIKTQSKRLKTTTKTSRGDKYAEGWTIAVLREIEKLAMTAREEELAERWLEKKYTETTSISGREAKKARGHLEAQLQGYQHGRQVSLHQPVNGQGQVKLGGPV